ncbi:MAG: permease [Alphaproteobacteria bacterium]
MRRVAASRVLTPWSLVVAVPFLVLALDPATFLPFVAFAARALAGTLGYIAFAVVLIAGLKAAGAEAAVAGVFQGRETQMVVLASLLGGLAPFCSCEVIPFIAGLLAMGAPLSAIMAFWLSSPLIDPPSLLITAGALGWPFAIGKAAAAVGLGLFGGFAIKAAVSAGFLRVTLRSDAGSACGCGPSSFTGVPVWSFWREESRREVFRRSFIDNAAFLIKWLALAYVLEAVLITYVPASVVAGLVGGEGIGTVIVAALVGMPAYLNGYVAPPLLAGFMAQGMSAGAAMAFMVAGAVSSVPAMLAVWSLVGRAVFAAYLGLGLTGAIAAGLIFQLFM